MEQEIWKDIAWYNWLYQVSNLGRIFSQKRRNTKGGILRPWSNPQGYEIASIYKDGKQCYHTVHRLVALAFIPQIEWKDQVNHKNGDKKDNRVENLEWCTQWENIKHSYDIWLRKVTKNFYFYTNPPFKWILWEKHPKAIKIVQYDMNRKKIQEWGSIIDAANSLWLHRTNLVKACKRKLKSSWWFIWRYKDDDDLIE